MDGITINSDYSKLDAKLLNLANAMADPTPVLEEIGHTATRAVKQNFKEGGRPQKWPVSFRAQEQSGQTLLDTGNLRSSVSYDIRGKEVAVGSNVIYGPIHHFGGVIRAKAAKSLAFTLTNGEFVTKKSVTIPARPWLVLQDSTYKRFNNILRQHLQVSK